MVVVNNSRESFDWVEARSKCNVRDVFKHLREVVGSDIKSAERNAVVSAELESRTEEQFVVRTHLDPARPDWRTFFLIDARIEVRGPDDRNDNIVLTGRASLDGGNCCIETVVDGKLCRLRLWEFSRLALEPLFFKDR